MFNSAATTKQVEMFPGVVRRTMNSGERTTLVEVFIDTGAVVPAHSHPHEQIGYVVKGRALFEVGEERRELVAGDSYLIPGGVVHKVTGIEPTIAIDIFSPVRTEYLD